MTKIAYGCESVAYLRDRFAEREGRGPFALTTRYRPKRAEEMIGGSLYWIVHHSLAARNAILGFENAPDGRTFIMLDPVLIPVCPLPKRAHQGWRYLEGANAPQDLPDWDSDSEALPYAMAKTLSDLGLV